MSNLQSQDWNPRSTEVLSNQRAASDAMRERCPVAYSDMLGWSLFRHEDIVRVLNDPITFSSVVSRNLSVPNGMDSPEHEQYRRVIEPYFAQQALQALEPRCLGLAENLVQSLRGRMEFELMDDFARPFAVQVQCAFLGWPASMHESLCAWAQKNQAASFAVDRQAMADIALEFSGYVKGLLQRSHAVGTDARQDVTTRLASENLNGRALSEDEIVSILRNWTVGEVSTIAAAIGVVTQFLAANAELQQLLRAQPLLLDAAIDEILRLYGPLLTNRRVTTREVEIGGRTIGAGERISLHWVSANRDDSVFNDALTFRLDRSADANLLYGAGVHVCPGAALARMELRIAFQALLAGTTRVSLVAQRPATHAVYPASGFAMLPVKIEFSPQ